MSSTNQKLAMADRAIREMRKAEKRQKAIDFDYHFAAYLALLGAVRQYMLVDPHKPWVYALDDTDAPYCAVVCLRDIDVHVKSVPHVAHHAFSISGAVNFVVGFIAEKIDGKTGGSTVLVNQQSAQQPSQKAVAVAHSTWYHVDRSALPSSFMIYFAGPNKGLIRPLRSNVEQLLDQQPAVDIAESALIFFKSQLAPALAQGIALP